MPSHFCCVPINSLTFTPPFFVQATFLPQSDREPLNHCPAGACVPAAPAVAVPTAAAAARGAWAGVRARGATAEFGPALKRHKAEHEIIEVGCWSICGKHGPSGASACAPRDMGASKEGHDFVLQAVLPLLALIGAKHSACSIPTYQCID